MTSPYYECHITIEPVFDQRLALFEETCAPYKFRVAKLLMQKKPSEEGEPSKKDSFCTGHGLDFEDIHERMMTLSAELTKLGYAVWRRKIEHVIFDEKLAR